MAGKERATKWEMAGHTPTRRSQQSENGRCPRCDQRLIPDYDGLVCPSCGHHTYEQTPRPEMRNLISSGRVTRLRYAGTMPMLEDKTVDLQVCEGRGDAVRFKVSCVFCGQPMERTQENSFHKYACPQDHRIELVVKSDIASGWK